MYYIIIEYKKRAYKFGLLAWISNGVNTVDYKGLHFNSDSKEKKILSMLLTMI
jgi:hypothetical protein